MFYLCVLQEHNSTDSSSVDIFFSPKSSTHFPWSTDENVLLFLLTSPPMSPKHHRYGSQKSIQHTHTQRLAINMGDRGNEDVPYKISFTVCSIYNMAAYKSSQNHHQIAERSMCVAFACCTLIHFTHSLAVSPSDLRIFQRDTVMSPVAPFTNMV